MIVKGGVRYENYLLESQCEENIIFYPVVGIDDLDV